MQTGSNSHHQPQVLLLGNFLPTIEWAELLVQFVPVLDTKLTVLGRPGVSVIMVATDRKITLILYIDSLR